MIIFPQQFSVTSVRSSGMEVVLMAAEMGRFSHKKCLNSLTIKAKKVDVCHISRGGDSRTNILHGRLERKYKVPHFHCPYQNQPRHPLAAKFTDEAHKFLSSHGVEKQLGPGLWSALVSARTPEIPTFMSQLEAANTDPRDVLWVCKFMLFTFALDTQMDESDYADSPDKSCATVSAITLSLLWYNPEDERILKQLRPLYDSLTTHESRALVEACHQDLVHAKNGTKDLMDIEMPPIASAFRELWMEYCDAVPAEFILRQAYLIQDFLVGCIWEAKNRNTGYQISNLEEYFAIRRLTGFVVPHIVSSDLLIARSLKVPQIPNGLFYGSEMQSLLLAINDITAWHNDIHSAYKEIIVAEDGHNLVKILCEECTCSSYTEAGEVAVQMLQDRIASMERAYEELKAVAPARYQPAIERYITTCRDCISGTHQWHLMSPRYHIPA